MQRTTTVHKKATNRCKMTKKPKMFNNDTENINKQTQKAINEHKLPKRQQKIFTKKLKSQKQSDLKTTKRQHSPTNSIIPQRQTQKQQCTKRRRFRQMDKKQPQADLKKMKTIKTKKCT